MNRIYRHIWSKALGRLVVVPECARGAGGGKAGRRRNRRSAAAALLASTALAAPTFAQDALPTGGQVVSGAATIGVNGGAMTIDQSSERMIANWQGFSIGAGNSVTFNQPGASSVALNRVTGQDPSSILGNLNANGQVFLINPNGIAIGNTGRVQTGAFVASTLDITDTDFLSGTYSFAGTGGTIVNEGEITGGTVALIAPSVSNAGTITGNTALAGGTDVLLDFDGDGLLSVEVRGSTMETLVENKGIIKADGGVAILTAKGASAAMKGVVNNTGTVEANTIGTKNGRILLLGDKQHGEVKVAGKLKAKDVETAAAKVKLDRNVKVETSGGRWLINAADVTIDADYAATLKDNLANGSIMVSTANQTTGTGDITVASAITWNANTLELAAANNIAINAALKNTAGGLILGATGAITPGAAVNVGAFTLNSGSWVQNGAALPAFSATSFVTHSGSFLRVLGGDGSVATPYLVTDVYGLQGIGTSAAYLAASWKLANDIDASGTEGWERRFAPIGRYGGTAFTGRFDGGGHAISKMAALHEHRSGLFGVTSGATIENVGVREGRSTTVFVAGGIVGEATNATVLRNVYSTSTVQSSNIAGGLVGIASGGTTISNSYSTSYQNYGGRTSGGLVGSMQDSSITSSFATGYIFVSSPSSLLEVGGLVGSMYNSTISSSYWDTETTNRSIGVGRGYGNTVTATGLTTAQALQQASYAGFDFTNAWFMIEGSTRPFLRSEWQSTITNTHQLQLMAMKPDASYTLGSDIDFGTTLNGNVAGLRHMWATSAAVGAGFNPVGTSVNPFTGSLEGNGHTISNFKINRPTTADIGLFGVIGNSGVVRNLVIAGASIQGGGGVGTLAGTNHGTVENVHATGSVTSYKSIGGIGGLIGTNSGQVHNVSFTGYVDDSSLAGHAGGLIGRSEAQGVVTNAYAAGNVTGAYAGGLIASNHGSVANAYATAAVSVIVRGAGLIHENSGTVSNVYASGAVGDSGAGIASGLNGLVAVNSGSITNAFWNRETTRQSAGVGTGLTTAQMADPFRFIDAGWDFSTVWAQAKAGGAPVLRALTQAAVYNGYIRLSGDITRAYGDTASLGGIQLSGVGTGNVNLAWGSAINAGTNVGRYGWGDSGVLALSYSTGDAADYYVDYGTGGLTIDKRVLSLSGSRIYDGSTGVNAGNITIGNLANGETLDLAGIGRIDDKNAGAGRALSLGTLEIGDGTGNASNYTLTGGTHTVDIGRATISAVTGITSTSKTYNGMTGASLAFSGAGFTDVIAGDDLQVASATGTFADKNAGTGKLVTISDIVLGGADAGNYVLADATATTTADIAKATISSVSGITAQGKVYDSTRTASLDTSAARFNGMIAGDTLTVEGGSGAFVNKNAGTGKQVDITGLSLGGIDAGNYDLSNDTATTTADITKASLTLGGFTVADKVYDGTRTGVITDWAEILGVLQNDLVGYGHSGVNFSDRNAGDDKTVSITGITLRGTDAGNYTVASTATTTASISRATISSVTGITADGKTYDGTRAAALNTGGAGFAGMVSGDALTVASFSGLFADKNAGTGKRVDIAGLTLGGADAGNYVLADTTAVTTADIAKATIASVTGITAANKTYDGTTAATLGLGAAGFTGMIAGDSLTVVSATGAFSDKNAANGKTVDISGLALGGLDAGNYILAVDTATTSADIAKATLTLTGFIAESRRYDGTASAGIVSTGSLSGVFLSDDVGFGFGGTLFSDRNAGTNKVVTMDDIALHGADAGNYTIASTATTTADIYKRAISGISGIVAADKTYDGTRAAVLDTSAAGFFDVIHGDDLTVVSATGTFFDKNAGANKDVAISNVVFGGVHAGNYELDAQAELLVEATINRATISAVTGLTAYGKTYDGTTIAGLNTGSAGFTGQIAGDQLAVLTATGAFADRNARAGKAVAISGLTLGGADAANYVLADTTAATTADIARASLSVNGFTAAGKVYDGTTAAAVTASGALSGLFLNDDVSFSHSGAAFADKNAGSGKTVRLSGITLSGADAGNYTIADTATTTATIARAAITSVSGISALDKTYDGTRTARLDTTGAVFAGLLAGESLTVGAATGRFEDANPGRAKTVRVTGLTLGGIDAGNYVLLDDTATTQADIRALIVSPLPPVSFGGSFGGGFGGAFFTLSVRDLFTEPMLIDFSAWEPGDETIEDIQ